MLTLTTTKQTKLLKCTKQTQVKWSTTKDGICSFFLVYFKITIRTWKLYPLAVKLRIWIFVESHPKLSYLIKHLWYFIFWYYKDIQNQETGTPSSPTKIAPIQNNKYETRSFTTEKASVLSPNTTSMISKFKKELPSHWQ